MRSTLLLSSAALLALTTACTTAAPPAPDRSRAVGLSLREATALVEALEAKQVPAAQKPPAPTTMEGALAVLKTDRLDLFPGAVGYLSGQTTPEALALKTQLLLAWG